MIIEWMNELNDLVQYHKHTTQQQRHFLSYTLIPPGETVAETVAGRYTTPPLTKSPRPRGPNRRAKHSPRNHGNNLSKQSTPMHTSDARYYR